MFYFTGHSQDNNEFEPVLFDSGHVMVFEPDLRLHLAMRGTVEVIVAFPKPLPDSTAYYPFIRYGDASGHHQFMISINGKRNRIIFSNGIDTFFNPCDFTDGKFHQVALISSFGGNIGMVDAGPSSGTALPGFYNLNPLENQLHVGDLDGKQFTFLLQTLRVWGVPLFRDELTIAKEFKGWPERLEEQFASSLLAYTLFTKNSKDLYYTESEWYTTSYAGVADGNYYFYESKTIPGQVGKMTALSFLKSGDGIKNIIPLNSKGNDFVWAELYPIDSEQPLFTKSGKPYPYFAGNMEELKALFKSRSIETVTLDEKQKIRRIYGTHNGNRIVSLRVTTDQYRDITIAPLSPTAGVLETFCLEIPPHASFRGLIARQDAGGLRALAMVYSFDNENLSGHTILKRLYASGKWVGRNDAPPTRITSGAWDLNGNYRSVPVYSIKEVVPDSIYMLFKDQDSALEYIGLKKQGYSDFTNQGLVLPDNLMDKFTANAYRIHEAASVLFTESGITLSKGLGVLPTSLVRPKPYAPPHDDKIAWGGTFAQEQRPALSRANFVGYDIFKMDPRDLQKELYNNKEIFRYPAENSFDYYTTDNKIIVPHGLVFQNDNVGTEKVEAYTYSSQQQHASAWSMHVGAKIGVPLVCSFSENVEYSSEWAEMQANHYSLTTAKTIEGKYALILDKSRVQLSDEFIQAVEIMKHKILNRMNPDYLGFMESFGTHYAYAVTYGGMAFLDIVSTGGGRSKSSKEGFGIKVQAEATIEVVSAGVSGGYKKQLSDEFKADSSIEKVSFRTVGGNMSRNQGWSMSRGEEVPILLDLRPIAELFSPSFFDDPIVWTTMRRGIDSTLKNKARNVANALAHPSTLLVIQLAPGSLIREAEIIYVVNTDMRIVRQWQISYGNTLKFVIPNDAKPDISISYGKDRSNPPETFKIVRPGVKFCFSKSDGKPITKIDCQ